MATRTLGKTLMGLGLAGTVSAVCWWASFYDGVRQAIGGKKIPVECLYQLGGPCRIIGGVASFLGANPYDPRLLYVGVGALAVGLFLHNRDGIRVGMTPPSMGRFDHPSWQDPRPGRTRDFR